MNKFWIQFKYLLGLSGNDKDIEEERGRCGKLKAMDIIHYIKETFGIIMNQKNEEMLRRITEENKVKIYFLL